MKRKTNQPAEWVPAIITFADRLGNRGCVRFYIAVPYRTRLGRPARWRMYATACGDKLEKWLAMLGIELGRIKKYGTRLHIPIDALVPSGGVKVIDIRLRDNTKPPDG